MSVQISNPIRPLIGSAAVVLLGMLLALATALALSFVSLTKMAFALAGVLILVPALFVRDPTAYGLFLLILAIPFDVDMQLSKWLVDPRILMETFGLPSTGTLGIGLFLSDLILLVMIVPWLLQIWLGGRRFYFPKTAYIFIVYLVWALIVSLLEAPSMYLSAFELVRQLLYLLFFVYLANNIRTKAQFQAVLLALFAGLLVEAGAIIIFFAVGIGTDFNLFNTYLYHQNSAVADVSSNLTVAESGSWKNVSRSAGLFAHPAQGAYYFEYILPILMCCLMAADKRRDKILYGTLLVIGCTALFLTFSRSGMIGFLTATFVLFPLARWAGLISKKIFKYFLIFVIASGVAGSPLLIDFLGTRPDAVEIRLQLLQPAIDAFFKRPMTGGGLNNSSAVTEGSREIVLVTATSFGYKMTVVHNFYLITLVEVGVVGFLLYFGFFGRLLWNALRRMRTAATQYKVFLVGIVATLSGLAVHNMGDPFGGHAVQAMLYLHVGIIFAACLQIAERSVLAGRPGGVRATVSRLPARGQRALPSPS